jgi:hypothetical protein
MNRFLEALAVLALVALVILTGFLAVPARSQTSDQSSRMSLAGPTRHCFAVVVIENRLGVYNRDETLETGRGPVVINYRTVGGHNLTDADQVQVLSLPDGVMADPTQIDLPDGATGRICLMEWIGG